MKEIYRGYNDTEVVELGVNIECPHCGREWMEDGLTECGETYEITCDDEFEDGCGKTFQMHFDAN
ncbi:hypothetical protein [Oceanobacillus neutriphilus]|uniref:Uncharacterized protein n=1 Tax=Oceanobacillus neutriphilus TaxID=531815 RepID=A0ABQ2P3V1_9BACI|nr:hypothetical protein [Oceanobacillus neutriphilus]GGP17294.1 hypothetical protein GCM10011346_52590 [Oceanobacillus neutriphilus]